MIYELVLRNFDCSLEFVLSLLLLQPFNCSPVSFACNFQDWGCVILREIDFLLKICWSIPCLHPSWKVHTRIEICASLNHRKKTKADGRRMIPRKHTETLVLFCDQQFVKLLQNQSVEASHLRFFIFAWKKFWKCLCKTFWAISFSSSLNASPRSAINITTKPNVAGRGDFRYCSHWLTWLAISV